MANFSFKRARLCRSATVALLGYTIRLSQWYIGVLYNSGDTGALPASSAVCEGRLGQAGTGRNTATDNNMKFLPRRISAGRSQQIQQLCIEMTSWTEQNIDSNASNHLTTSSIRY